VETSKLLIRWLGTLKNEDAMVLCVMYCLVTVHAN